MRQHAHTLDRHVRRRRLRVERELRCGGWLVIDADAGHARARPAAELVHGRSRASRGAGSIARAARRQTAGQLHLGEVRNDRACEIPPLAPMRGGVHDHRHAGLGQRRGEPHERAIHEIALRVAVGRRRRHDPPHGVELQQATRRALGAEAGRNGARERRLAAGRRPRDPDRPAHRATPQSNDTSAGSKRFETAIDRAKCRS